MKEGNHFGNIVITLLNSMLGYGVWGIGYGEFYKKRLKFAKKGMF